MPLEFGDDTQRLSIVVETSVRGEALIERSLAGMTERWMTKVMGEAQGLAEIFVEAERPRQRAGDLRHFQRVRETRAKMIALMKDEYLGLVSQTTERARMDDAVAVAAKIAAGRARRLPIEAASARPWISSENRPRRHVVDRHDALIVRFFARIDLA